MQTIHSAGELIDHVVAPGPVGLGAHFENHAAAEFVIVAGLAIPLGRRAVEIARGVENHAVRGSVPRRRIEAVQRLFGTGKCSRTERQDNRRRNKKLTLKTDSGLHEYTSSEDGFGEGGTDDKGEYHENGPSE